MSQVQTQDSAQTPRSEEGKASLLKKISLSRAQKMAKMYLDFFYAHMELEAENGLNYYHSVFDYELSKDDLDDKIVYNMVVSELKRQGFQVDDCYSDLAKHYLSFDQNEDDEYLTIFVCWS